MDYKEWSSKLEEVVIGSGFRVNGSSTSEAASRAHGEGLLMVHG